MTKAIVAVVCLFGLSGCDQSCEDAAGSGASPAVLYDQDWSERREGADCCRTCYTSEGLCACGDSCISCDETCESASGCACNSDELLEGCGVE